MDLLGIFIAIIGAVTVVLSCDTSDVRLDPDALIQAISQKSFILFSCVYIAGAIVLAALSEARIGRNWVFVDVGICALFGEKSSVVQWTEPEDFTGGFTVLSTKAVSTLLTLEWLEMFTQWITYPIILVSPPDVGAHQIFIIAYHQVLIGTGVGQIRYLNRALMRFDSKVRQ
jgi:hypothetical protein